MIEVRCACGKIGQARQEFAGRRTQCPACGRVLLIPEIGPPPVAGAAPAASVPPLPPVAEPFREYLDPPAAPIAPKIKTLSLRRMFEALLDPQSIQWMLILGGGLLILGMLIWLISLNLFPRAYVFAVILGAVTLAILGTGWFVTLKTRYRIAGQAVTFLGCVVAPLNLWFYQSQQLLTLDNGLWAGGVVCCLLYAATVYVLRDGLFMYAVEAGATLTAGLLLAEVAPYGEIVSSTCMVLMALGLISVHGERAFPPEGESFDRRRFGMPLFWSGHVQLAIALVLLLVVQSIDWLRAVGPGTWLAGVTWDDNLLTRMSPNLLAGALWLAGTYVYLYSDIVVRRVGVYTFLAAFCFLLAEVTLVGLDLPAEWLIGILAMTALAATVTQTFVAAPNEKINRAVPPLAMALSCLPVLLGVALHFRATSEFARDWGWHRSTDWLFVGAMVLVAMCNRVSAFLCRRTAPKWSAAYFFGSAAATLVAAAGVLRMLGLESWIGQAPWLMILPIAYLVAGRLWRGHSPERPLGWIAHAATAAILLGIVGAAVHSVEVARLTVNPVQGERTNLLLGLAFAEASAFYVLAGIFRRRSVNLFFATAAGCGALWQLLGYWHVEPVYHTMLFAMLGVSLLAVARAMGVERIAVYRSTGAQCEATRGKGLVAFQAGNAVVTVALLTAFLQGLSRIATHSYDWPSALALLVTTAASAAAIGLSPGGGWRRWYITATVAMAGLAFLTISLQSRLTAWQKLEIFCTLAGVLLVAVSYVGHFREAQDKKNEMVTWGFSLGSVLATMPLLIAVVYWHFFTPMAISLIDELALITVTIAMLVTGFSWQIRSTTFFGGATFGLYIVMLLVDLGRQQNWAVGVYLAIAGGVVFLLGVLLSIYRERLLTLPEQISHREGVFRILGWR